MVQGYWDSRNQIEIWKSASEVPHLATESSSQDWVDTGKLCVANSYASNVLTQKFRMFANKRYAQALVAFQRAGKSRQVAICHAFFLRENARAVADDQVKKRVDAFGEAGEAFSTCANGCLPDQVGVQLAYFTNAAECFVQGGRLKEAGDCFLHAEKYSKAARAYRQGAHFDQMVEVLERHGHQIEAGLLAQLKKVAQMNYFKAGRPSNIAEAELLKLCITLRTARSSKL